MMPPFPVEEYKTITEASNITLNAKVNKLLQEGWVLWGSPCTASNQFGQHYSQTMIKLEQPPSKFVDENHPPDENFPPEYFQL
jgi:hypothetical protein